MAEPEGLMTLRQVVEYLHVSRGAVLRLVHCGDLPAVRIGRGLRFERCAVDDWLISRRVAASGCDGTEKGETECRPG